MRRTGFRRHIYEPPPAAPLRRLERPVVYGTCTGVPVPKGEPARPGKRKPTAEESRWMDWIVARGCIACWLDGLGWRPACVHHILRGGVRMGHLQTLPLCQPGHHMDGQSLGLVSRHPWKTRFESRYGTEADLLDRLQMEYGEKLDRDAADWALNEIGDIASNWPGQG